MFWLSCKFEWKTFRKYLSLSISPWLNFDDLWTYLLMAVKNLLWNWNQFQNNLSALLNLWVFFIFFLHSFGSYSNLVWGRSFTFGLQNIDFFYIFRKYNILIVHCKNVRPKYEIFTKLQHIVESAPRLISLI